MTCGKPKLYALGNNVNIYVTKDYSFCTDTILLANFSSDKKVKKAMDLCCGSGTISLIWCRDNVCSNIYAVDIQKEACDLLQQSLDYNNFGEHVTVINEDLNELKFDNEFSKFDMICVNPPYRRLNTGMMSKKVAKTIANHEKNCNLEDIIRFCAKNLKFSGSIYICNRVDRLSETVVMMKSYKLEPKILRIIQQTITSSPKLFLLKATFGGKQGLKILPTLMIQNTQGEYTEDFKSIYGSYFNH